MSVSYDPFAIKSLVATRIANSLGLAIHEGVCTAVVTILTDNDQFSAPFTLGVAQYVQYDISLGQDWIAISGHAGFTGKYTAFICFTVALLIINIASAAAFTEALESSSPIIASTSRHEQRDECACISLDALSMISNSPDIHLNFTVCDHGPALFTIEFWIDSRRALNYLQLLQSYVLYERCYEFDHWLC